MKVMVVSTYEADLRAEIWGWKEEDSSLYVPNKPIGMTPAPKYSAPGTVLQALAEGWRLLGPPQIEGHYNEGTAWDWWLVAGE